MNELAFPAYSEYYDQNTTYSKGEITATVNGTDFSLDSTAYKNYKSGILAKVNGSVDFDKTSITLKEGKSTIVTDRGGLLEYMVLRENTANVTAVQNGNSITITASASSHDGKLVFKRTTAAYDNNDGATKSQHLWYQKWSLWRCWKLEKSTIFTVQRYSVTATARTFICLLR